MVDLVTFGEAMIRFSPPDFKRIEQSEILNMNAGGAEWNVYFSKKYEIEIVDRIGGGDSFSAGLIYSLVNKRGYQEAIDFAVAFSALKQTIPTDTNWTTLEEVENDRKRELAAGSRISESRVDPL